MRILIGLAVFTLLTACASSGSRDRLPEGAEALRPAPSVYALIGDRESLALTSEQITSLDSIGEWIARANSPLFDRLSELGVSPVGLNLGGRRAIPDEARPVLDQISANNDQANAGVASVLTTEQKSSACRDRTPRSTPNRAARRPAEARDSTGLMRPGRWDWCPAPAREA